ncbi:MAG TPA: hypothetical protein VGN23_04040 [Verrucomicrobiae bacterium]|jgi:hypothetical protein
MNAPLHRTGKKEAMGRTAKNNSGSRQNSGDTELFLKEIHHRAETITPVLKQILENRPASHWGTK